MAFFKETIPWRITDNASSFCARYGCSAIAFFFEYVGDGNYIAHRTCFDSRQIISLLDGQADGKLRIHDTQRVVSFSELRAVINGFLHGLKGGAEESIREAIWHNCADFLNSQFRESDFGHEWHTSFVDGLNQAFFGYAYNPASRSFERDDSALIVDERVYIPEDRVPEDNILVRPVVEETIAVTPYLYELRVYSVGQANCSALIRYVDETKQDYTVAVVFDFGCANRKKGNPDLQEMISKIDNNTTIIISHFDNDHFNNITDLDLAKTVRWIFPNCLNRHSIRANKMFQTLMAIAHKKTRDGSIILWGTPRALSDHIHLYQNEDPAHMDHYQSTPTNAYSLVATIRSETVSILLPADALYEEFHNEILESTFDWVLVPHHGCQYRERSTDPWGAINRILGGKWTNGIVQCGKNKYGHANIDHLSWYSNVFYFDGADFYDATKVLVTPPDKTTRVYGKFIKIPLK